MIRAFLGNRLIIVLLLPFLVAFYQLLHFFFGHTPVESQVNLGFWGNVSLIWNPGTQAIAGALICTNAVLINSIFNWNEFYEKNTYVSSLLYVVLMSFYSSFYQADGILLAHFFLILTIFQLFKLRQGEDGRKTVFNAGFFAGIAASFHPPLIALLPLLFVMEWSVRPFVFREVLLTCVGFGVPLLYVSAYLYTTNQDYHLSMVPFERDIDRQKTDFVVSASLLICSFLLSLAGVNARLRKSSIRLKKIIRILAWFVAAGIALGVFDILRFNQFEQFSFVMIPLGFFFPYSFLFERFRLLANGLFYLLFAYSVLKFFL